ncbi:Cystathionine beta-synthase, core [Cynara cardunculus var. scolymus]|uniref:Cystathionine beta-synthase, core n=1 Tax=Cynara cardunculus var. scolymus TaxID=59895 RepID=A0A118JVB1_CYNCS|nr:Cystathionine beta-synthase, core [Cynara cardunculus var. scolymus]
MASIPPLLDPLSVSHVRSATVFHHQIPCLISSPPSLTYRLPSPCILPLSRRPTFTVAAAATLTGNSVPVGLVSDYDLLALDSVSGATKADTSMFPEVDSTWKTFNEVQKLLSKTDGKLVGDLMTPAPLVVRENTNLEDAARLLLETKYRRLPVVDGQGKLVGIITRGNVVRAALQIKKAGETQT